MKTNSNINKFIFILGLSMSMNIDVSLAQTNTGNRFKRVDYNYDLVSGNVKSVHYQAGEADQIHHKYEYDEDNKITNVYTSKDSVIWDQDAKYFYYKHGPLARTELGTEKVQAMDYAYNLQGWIKGVNSNNLNPNNDIGNDGKTSSVNKNIAIDAFGYSLNYFNTDYQAIDASKNVTANSFVASLTGATHLATNAPGLFNGNISAMVTTITDIDPTNAVADGTPLPQLTAYRYDQLNRIKQMKAYRDIDLIDNASFNGSTYDQSYETHLTYDANGNIQTLKRNGLASTNLSMDDMEYKYENIANGYKRNTNKLIHVDDNVASGNYATDIDDQGTFVMETFANYHYDEIGNLIEDYQEEIADIEWTVHGKIKSITRAATSGKPDLVFNYDAGGNRISKTVKPHATLTNPATWTTTYYVLDASGNVMSTYQDKENDGNFYLQEQSIYGRSRIGVLNRDFNLTISTYSDLFAHTLGKKQYELSNHLGNVLSTVTDRKLAFDSNNNGIVDYFQARIASSTDYGIWGDPLTGRTFTGSTSYKYGMSGKEKDDEIKGAGNSYDYGARIYDPRLGRWLAIDPLAKKYPEENPYNYCLNNPIYYLDPDGKEVEPSDATGTLLPTAALGVLIHAAAKVYFDKKPGYKGEVTYSIPFLKQGRADVVYNAQNGKGAIWEIKPISYFKKGSEKNASANAQVAGYVTLANMEEHNTTVFSVGSSGGAPPAIEGTVYLKVTDGVYNYDVSMFIPKGEATKGLIYYQITNKQLTPEAIAIREKAKEVLENAATNTVKVVETVVKTAVVAAVITAAVAAAPETGGASLVAGSVIVGAITTPATTPVVTPETSGTSKTASF